MVTRGLQCEFCKVTPYETPVKNAFEDDVNEIIELNHWRPVKISEAMTQTSAIKCNFMTSIATIFYHFIYFS